jgi:MoxR-like ATPase
VPTESPAPLSPDQPNNVSAVAKLAASVAANVEQVVIGKRERIELLLTTMLCEGHALLEDVPGVGKTMLARAIALSIGGSFKRIQFTPDLLPSDVTGVDVYDQREATFTFRPGPIHANLVLADEINRATPKTQSALLEAMEERQVTVDRETYPLPEPFTVLATENPIEFEGTFPLPEAQLDRFVIRLSLGYPGRDNEIALLERQHHDQPLSRIGAVAAPADIIHCVAAARETFVAAELRSYIVSLVEATRAHDDAFLGASPRGSLALYNLSRGLAFLRGREYVTPDDIKLLAQPALAHRIVMQPSARMAGREGRDIVAEVLRQVPVPGGARDEPRRRSRLAAIRGDG